MSEHDRKWDLPVSRLFEQIRGEDAWRFLKDLSMLLYDLDQAGVLHWGRMPGEAWGDAVDQVRREYPPLSDFGAPMPRVDDMCSALVTELLRRLSQEPERHAEIAQAFWAALRRATALRSRQELMTPPPLAGMIADMLEPRRGDLVMDPACGSGVLLAAAAARRPDSCFYGVDSQPPFAAITWFHLYFCGCASTRTVCQDLFQYARDRREHFDIILANPPYSSDLSETLRILETIQQILRPGGRCGVLVPEGVLSNAASSRAVEFRARLLREHTLEAVISLPPNIYRPYTISKSSLLVFRKGPPASRMNIFFSELLERWEQEDAAVYQADMDRIVETWRRFDPACVCRDPAAFFWTAAPEDVRKAGGILSASTYRPSPGIPEQARTERGQVQLLRRQRTLEALFAHYMEELS